MTKRKAAEAVDKELLPQAYTFHEPTPTLPVAVKVEAPAPVKPYEAVKWAGVLDIFRCSTCGHCEDDESNMILHVLEHVPEGERAALLDRLTKEK